eukprot:3097409-Pyramimonas_sp.AAC.1
MSQLGGSRAERLRSAATAARLAAGARRWSIWVTLPPFLLRVTDRSVIRRPRSWTHRRSRAPVMASWEAPPCRGM